MRRRARRALTSMSQQGSAGKPSISADKLDRLREALRGDAAREPPRVGHPIVGAEQLAAVSHGRRRID
eukprot:7047112-Alexandrium_andersonii.AAC.1